MTAELDDSIFDLLFIIRCMHSNNDISDNSFAGSDIPNEERECFLVRKRKCDIKMRQLLSINETVDFLPTFAVAVSGGGVRALTSTVGLIDAFQDDLLECTCYFGALSGSSWALARYMTIQNKQPAFHIDQQARDFKGLDLSRANLAGEMTSMTVLSGGDVLKSWAKFCENTFLSDGEFCSFAELREKLKDGNHPIPICTAVTEKENASKLYRSFVEFTPFQVRECHKKNGTKTEDFDADLPMLFAIWGSAYSFDIEWAESKGERQRTAVFKDALPLNQVWTGNKLAGEGGTMTLRDAGIDCNLPIAPFTQSNRDVDVLLVLDASADAKACEELKLAKQKGYIEIRAEDRRKLDKEFGSEKCRVFFPPAGVKQPIIIYVLGLRSTDTLKFDFSAEQLRKGSEYVRSTLKDCRAQILNVLASVVERNISQDQASVLYKAPEIPNQLRDALKKYYAKKYEHMSLLIDGEKRSFPLLMNHLHVVKWNRQHASIVAEYGMDDAVEAFERSKRVVIEGPAGSGKTTLMRHYAREQLFHERYGCVLMVELNRLTRLKEFNLANVLKFAIPVNFPEKFIDILKENSDGILWIFDGYDEIEFVSKRRGQKFNRFLRKLQNGRLKWASNCILSSRPERKSQLSNIIELRLKPWNNREVERYVDKFFTTFEKSKDLHEKAKGILTMTEKFEPTPLICEMVCHIVDDEIDETTELAVIYEKVVKLFWNRALSKKGDYISRQNDLLEVQKQAAAKLTTLALQSLKDGAGDICLNCQIVGNKAANEVDYAIFKSGLVSSAGNKASVDETEVRCTFAHNTLGEYEAAVALCRLDIDEFKSTLSGIIRLDSQDDAVESGNRMLVVFIASIVRLDRAKWEVLVTCLSEQYLSLCDKFKESLNKADLEDYNVQNQWTKSIGLDLVVEAVTILGDDATNLFLQKRSPWYGVFASITPNAWARELVPRDYRLMASIAARYGNLLIVQNCIEFGGKDKKELNRAALEAFVSRRGREVSNFLVKENLVDPISLSLALHVGNLDALKKVLEDVPMKDLTEALCAPLSTEMQEEIGMSFAFQKLSKNGFDDSLISRVANAQNDLILKRLLGCFSKLQTFEGLTDKGVQCLSLAFPRLLRLSLRDRKVNAPLLASLCSHFTQIKQLDLTDCNELNEGSFFPLAKMTTLEELNLQYCKIGNAELKQIGVNCLALKKLDCSLCTNLNDSGFLVLSNCVSLQDLNLTRTAISDVGVQAITFHCTQLQSLKLSQCSNLSNDGFIGWQCKELQKIDLRKTSIGDTGIMELVSCCPNLESVNLCSCGKITDEGCSELLKLNKLRHVSLAQCNISREIKSKLKSE